MSVELVTECPECGDSSPWWVEARPAEGVLVVQCPECGCAVGVFPLDETSDDA